jgi:hypothetical protein
MNKEELTKEIYAQFGLAYYFSECLHRSLCICYAVETFQRPQDITRPRLDEKLAEAFQLTLGQLIEKMRHLLPPEIQNRVELALGKRNYLAHHFWFKRCDLMFSEEGLLELIRELPQMTDLFSELDRLIEEHLWPKLQTVGITEELIQSSREKIITGEPDEISTPPRKLKKQERIIRIWDVKAQQNLSALIFEADDGCFWQLCDLGLGWTKFKTRDANWSVNQNIQQYLPATFNSRPAATEPWNYEFSLAKGAILWVKREAGEKHYVWGIKTSKH